MNWQRINSAPEGKQILVGWRDQLNRPMYFVAMKQAESWWSNGRLIARPDYWTNIDELP